MKTVREFRNLNTRGELETTLLMPEPEPVIDDAKLKRAARKHLWGQKTFIAKGRSCNSASVCNDTAVHIVEGSQAPVLEGGPYLKTQFRGKNGFSKVLYTPSTMRIVVGREWKP